MNKEWMLGICSMLVSVFFIWQTSQLPEGDHVLNSSRSFPMLLGVLLMIVSAFQLVKAVRHKTAVVSPSFGNGNIRRGVFYVLWTGIYIFVGIPFIGFILATLLYLFIGITFYKEVRWYQVLPISVGSILLFYFVFTRLMYIQLP